MKASQISRFFIAAFCLALSSPVNAQPQTETDSGSISTVEDRLIRLEKELAELKFELQKNKPTVEFPESPKRTSLGRSIAKFYQMESHQPMVGLTAEFFTFRAQRGASPNQANLASVSPSLAYWIHPRLLFVSQFLFENAGAERSNTVTVRQGQAIVQTAYVDWISYATRDLGIRIGHQLIPIGQINTLNEPGSYLGIHRPPLETAIIPTPWHENGVSLWIDRPNAEIQLGVFNSLNAQGFRKETFLAGGRSQGQLAKAESLMGAFRTAAKWDHLQVGVSTAFGNSAQKTNGITTGTFILSEAHMLWRWPRVRWLWTLTEAKVQQADSISIMNGTVMAESARGHAIEASIDLLGRQQQLWFFLRRSQYDLHDRIPDGFQRDRTLHKTIGTIGFQYVPISSLVFKTDYSFRKNAEADEDDEVAFSAGISF